MTNSSEPAGALAGIRVLDLSRVLAGPTATQLLGDLGADVVKVENPRTGGDDTRRWGPPFVADADGAAPYLSGYFVSANRNKRSVAADFNDADDLAMVQRLIADADVVIENFVPGTLARFGLDHRSVLAAYPSIVYCSISGFGQTGPNAHKPGYDLLAQGFGGIMSVTGEPGGAPMKVGLGIADVMCGMYATVGILAALRHRDSTGVGQHIDLALVDTQIAWLINVGVNFLISDQLPQRWGNDHPNIVPYGVYEASDGHVIVAVGNDSQFGRLCDFLEVPELVDDARFATNPARLANRHALDQALRPLLRQLTREQIVRGLEDRSVSVGPVNDLAQVFSSDQVSARGMVRMMDAADSGPPVPVIANPLNLSATPVTYRRVPPRFGDDTHELRDGWT